METKLEKQTTLNSTPDEWMIKSIGDVCDLLTGFPFKGNLYSESEGIKVLRGENVSIGFLRWDTIKYWKYSTRGFEKYFLKKGDVVVGMDGSRVGKNRAQIQDSDLPLLLAQRVARLRAKEGLDQDFLSYVILDTRFEKYVEAVHTGTSIPHISGEQIKAFTLAIPPLTEQKEIAFILSILTSKIQINQRMNKTLEGIGQALFKRWFVDFEFPNQEGKPYKSSGGEMVESDIGMIPKSWSIGSYNDLADVFSGKGLKRDCFAEDGEYPVLGANGEIGRTNSFLYNERLILTGRVGTLGQVYLTSGRVWVSDNVLISRPKSKENYYYAYFVLKSFDISSLNRGSTQPLVTQTDLKNQKAIIPDQKTMCTFEHVVTTLYAKVDQNHQQNILLSKIRDTLLPRLLSGKVRVPVLKESVEVQ